MRHEWVSIQDLQKDDAFTSFIAEVAKSNESVLGYHSIGYLNMLQEIGVGEFLGLVIKEEETERMLGFIPGFVKTSTLGSVYSSMPFFGPNASLIYDRQLANAESLHQYAFNEVSAEMKARDVISYSLYTPFHDDLSKAFYDEFFKEDLVVEKFTSFIELSHLNLSTSLQYDIRKALKSGVVLRNANSSDVQAVFEIYMKNCEDYGIPPKPYECVEKLISNGSENGFTESYVAELEGKIIGGLIMVYAASTASYYLPCSIHEYRSMQPTTLLIKHAMDRSIERGIKFWNWEASPSKDSGVFKFKQKWGSEEGQYKIFISPQRDKAYFKNLGSTEISTNFPFFFVYPFNQL